MNLQQFENDNPELFEYIDVEEGIGRLRNNKRIYNLVLSEFLKDTHIDQTLDLAESGNLEEASKTAHAIKGITANLSMKKAYSDILEIEQKLKVGEYDKDLLLNAVASVAKTKELTQIILNNLEDIDF